LENSTIINLHKTVKVVFHHPNPKVFVYPALIKGTGPVFEAKLLGAANFIFYYRTIGV